MNLNIYMTVLYFVTTTADNEYWNSYMRQKDYYTGRYDEMLKRKNEQYYSRRQVNIMKEYMIITFYIYLLFYGIFIIYS